MDKMFLFTQYSQAVTHPSTNRARGCLTSVIGRELVYSIRYGRRHKNEVFMWKKCFCSQNDLKYPKINKKGNLKQSQKPTTPDIPRRFPFQVLTRLVVA